MLNIKLKIYNKEEIREERWKGRRTNFNQGVQTVHRAECKLFCIEWELEEQKEIQASFHVYII